MTLEHAPVVNESRSEDGSSTCRRCGIKIKWNSRRKKYVTVGD